ncbi:hypothetical protein [Mesorhizobium silamurunense]|uniref:hypothetical protein n=1 Tax=Mesorhizobium silamurunense TaxID=499528 RepID=UPI00177BAE08|nr:hypothetical protein [Mesorhizobium silamurunense]
MKLADIDATSARDFLRGILDRNKPRGNVAAWKVEVHLGIEGARTIWAIGRYLEVHKTRGVGVEITEFSITRILEFLNGVIAQAKALPDDEKVMVLNPREMRLLKDAERHLDHYCIINMPGVSMNKSSGGGKKK